MFLLVTCNTLNKHLTYLRYGQKKTAVVTYVAMKTNDCSSLSTVVTYQIILIPTTRRLLRKNTFMVLYRPCLLYLVTWIRLVAYVVPSAIYVYIRTSRYVRIYNFCIIINSIF